MAAAAAAAARTPKVLHTLLPRVPKGILVVAEEAPTAAAAAAAAAQAHAHALSPVQLAGRGQGRATLLPCNRLPSPPLSLPLLLILSL